MNVSFPCCSDVLLFGSLELAEIIVMYGESDVVTCHELEGSWVYSLDSCHFVEDFVC